MKRFALLTPGLGVWALLAGAAASPAWYVKGRLTYTDRIAITIENPLDADRRDVPVVIRLDALRRAAPKLEAGSLVVVDPIGKSDAAVRREVNGVDVSSQVDDLNGDGTADELAFVIDLEASETKRLYLYSGAGVTSRYPARTYAMAWAEFLPKRILTGWESDTMGFNHYAGKVDIFAKRRPGIHYDRFVHGAYGSFHHGDMLWGADILHVGGSMGCGGLQVSADGKKWTPFANPGPGSALDKPANMPKVKVLAKGPVRTAMVFTYDAWKVGGKTFRVVDRVEIFAGARGFLHDVTVKGAGEVHLRSGVHCQGEKAHVAEEGRIGTWVLQNPQYGGFGMGLIGDPSMPSIAGAERAGEPNGNRFIAFSGSGTLRAKFHVRAAWSQGGVVKDAAEWAAWLEREQRAALSPPKVTIGAHTHRPASPTKESTIEGLTVAMCNPSPLPSVLPVEMDLERYGLTYGADALAAEAGGRRSSVDVIRERGRPRVCVAMALPRAAVEQVRFVSGEGGESPFAVREEDGLLRVSGSLIEWVFDGSGLRAFGPAGEKDPFILSDATPAGKATVAYQGRVACIVTCASGTRYTLYANAPLWKVEGPDFDLACNGRLHVSMLQTTCGRSPALAEGHQAPLDLFYPADWSVVMAKDGSVGLWIGPTLSASRLVATDEGETVRIRRKPVDPSDKEDYAGLRARCDQGGSLGPWDDPQHAAALPACTVWCGLVSDPVEGKTRLMQASAPLAVTGGRAYGDFDGDGVTDTVVVEDRNGNGPDFTADAWYWDMQSDGSIQSIFAFVDDDQDGTADHLLAHGDYDDFHRDGVVDLAGREGKHPLVAFHDKTRDGVFFNAGFFGGGPLAQDEVEVQMYQSVYVAHRLIKCPHPELKKFDVLDEHLTWGFQAIDLDDDGDWDIGTRINFRGRTMPHRAMLNTSFDQGDGNAAVGAILNPATGYYFYRHFPNYHVSMDYPMWYTGEQRVERCKDGWTPQSLDCPQGDINLDDDPMPELHTMAQVAVIEDELHYTVSRMALNLDNDTGALKSGPPYLRGGVRHYAGRSYDVCVLPKNYTTHRSYERLPVYPYPKASVFRDPHGNELRILAKYVPDGWDGKALGTFDENGKHRPWTNAWYWDMKQDWDLVMAFWREGDINPESSQGWRPMHRMRYDVDRAGPYRFAFYSNPVTGFLHFVGSDFGIRLGMLRKDYQKLLAETWWDGFDNSWSCIPRDCDLVRGYSESFELYLDTDEDGFFDTYLVDADNDGFYEKRLWHDQKGKGVLLALDGKFCRGTLDLSFTPVGMELENYQKMVALYTKARGHHAGRLLDALPQHRGAALEPDETVRTLVAIDAHHVKANPWSNHWPAGYSRLFTALSRHPVGLRALTVPFSAESLKGVTVLVIAGMDFDRLPTDEEIKALDAYLRSGGTAIVCYPEPGDVRAVILNALLEPYGAGIVKRELRYDEKNDPHIVNPHTYDRSRYVTGSMLTEAVRKLYIRGYSLSLDDGAEPLLAFKKQPIAARVPVGKGTLYVFGAPLLNNRYTAHNQKDMPRSRFPYKQSMCHTWQMPDNNLLLDAFVDGLLD